MDQGTRREKDFLGERDVPSDSYHGIHSERALENFLIAGRPVHASLTRAYGMVKLACAQANAALGAWEETAKTEAIVRACREMADGLLREHVRVDALQGGAGTSLNMNVNEVLANRALEILGFEKGRYDLVSPLEDLNRHQSTNDTFPTALRLAAIWHIKDLEASVLELQEAFQEKERAFAHVVKVGRTQIQDAALTTLGREMGAYAEAFNRDRWRIYKCEERLRVVNLGGTAIGTGLAAPRKFIFTATERLRELTGVPFARAENLVEATQNADVFVEVSGILKACAASLVKVCSDLRLMASGPQAGLGEIKLPAVQAGSSIMPGKVNPVVPEAVTQAGFLYMGYDQVICAAASAGSLELNPFLPLVAHCLLDGTDLLSRGCQSLARLCVKGLEADEARCRSHVESSTATATALVPALGYEAACALAKTACEQGLTIREAALRSGLLTQERFEELVSPEAVMRLGSPEQFIHHKDTKDTKKD